MAHKAYLFKVDRSSLFIYLLKILRQFQHLYGHMSAAGPPNRH